MAALLTRPLLHQFLLYRPLVVGLFFVGFFVGRRVGRRRVGLLVGLLFLGFGVGVVVVAGVWTTLGGRTACCSAAAGARQALYCGPLHLRSTSRSLEGCGEWIGQSMLRICTVSDQMACNVCPACDVRTL